MKPCPYCAEEIQDAASVCKHCGKDLNAPARRSRRAGWLIVVVACLVAFGMWYVWATSAASVDVAAATRIVADLERDGLIRNRSCNPNRAEMTTVAWRALPSRSQENLMNALAATCRATGQMDMHLIEVGTGRTLAVFDGWSIQ